MSGSADLVRGRLIVLEGIDGCGKTTQAAHLAESLGAILTREPGATALGVELRSILLDSTREPLSLRAEALLMAADRAEHVEQILRPSLASGEWVVCDRFNASTLAYQGFGRQLNLTQLLLLVDFATAGVEPDLQILLDLPVELARERMRSASLDRLEHLGDEFFNRVRHGYLSLAASDPDHWMVVDATEEVSDMARLIYEAVVGRLGGPSRIDDLKDESE
jgi:dTMP kinase